LLVLISVKSLVQAFKTISENAVRTMYIFFMIVD